MVLIESITFCFAAGIFDKASPTIFSLIACGIRQSKFGVKLIFCRFRFPFFTPFDKTPASSEAGAMVTELVQRAGHAGRVAAGAGRPNYRARRAAGDVGLLRGRFRDHLGFLVSHLRLLSEGDFPHFVYI